MKWVAAVLVAMLMLGGRGVNAQAQDEAHAKQPRVVNGREHPELIPDALAYRMVFIHLSQFAGDPEKERVWLRAPGLSEDDTEVLLRIMTAFKKEFDAIVKAYNDAVEEASRRKEPPDPSDIETFKSKRKELVAETRKEIAEGLKREGVVQFREYVATQKHTMTVTLDDE